MTEDVRRPPCRLFVYLATEAPVGVVLRRGPSDWVRLSLWRTDSDRFEHGQWMRARVYERRCDVPPDGSLFAYFAHQGSGRPRSLSTDSWAAISRPPWFTALAVWGIGTTYFSGGLFLDEGTLFLGGVSDEPDIGRLPGWLRLAPDPPARVDSVEWADRLVHVNRLQRAGWVPSPSTDATSPTWSRPREPGGPVLTMVPDPGWSGLDFAARAFAEYGVEAGEQRLSLGRATWADWDQQGRLVLAQDGALQAVDLPGGERHVLEDFEQQQPERSPPPAIAERWPSR